MAVREWGRDRKESDRYGVLIWGDESVLELTSNSQFVNMLKVTKFKKMYSEFYFYEKCNLLTKVTSH